MVLPGSGCTPTRQCNFYDWFGRTVDAIEAADGTPKYGSIMKNMPDRTCAGKRFGSRS